MKFGLTKDRSITVVSQEYAVSYGAYFLEEASFLSTDCVYE